MNTNIGSDFANTAGCVTPASASRNLFSSRSICWARAHAAAFQQLARLGRFDEAKAAIDDSYPESESVRYLAYADLLPVVDAGKREPLLTAIRSHYESVRAEDRATLIVALASYAQPEESTRLILDALRLLVSDAVWSRRKRGVLEDIVPLLERLPPETLKAQLRELLRTFARQDRDQFEIALWMLIPSLRRIGGDACLKRISETIADLGSWLP